MAVKKVVDAIKKVVTPKIVVVKEESVVNNVCPNCENSGLQCAVCSKPFEDTFK